MSELTSTKKIEWLQIMRGLATIFVVFGHIVLLKYQSDSVDLISGIIYLFHMPLFFAMSGFLFGFKEIVHPSAYIIKKKLIVLGIPYLVFSALYIVMKILLQNIVRVESEVAWIDLIRLFFFPANGDSVNWYWFLYALIFYFIVFALVKNKKNITFVLIFLSVLIFFIWKGKYYMVINGCFQRSIGYMFCFGIAIFLGKKYSENQSALNSKKLIICYFVLSGIFLFLAPIYLKKIEANLFIQTFGGILVAFARLFFLLSGICLTYILSLLFRNTRILKRCILIIADYSLYIYLLHSYALNLVRNIIVRFDISVWIYVLINLLSGVYIPIILGLIIKKIPIFEFFFYPGKYIKIQEKKNND